MTATSCSEFSAATIPITPLSMLRLADWLLLEPFSITRIKTLRNSGTFATRPVDRNGFGLTVADVDQEVRVIEKGMVLLADSEAIYHEWRRLVVAHSVSGVKVHDARLASAMKVHDVTHLLTLNPDDFKRYPHITAVHPGNLAYSG